MKLIVAGTQGLFSVDVLYYNTSTVIGHRISHMTGTSQLLLAREADAVVYDPITDSVTFHDVMSRTIRSMPFKGEYVLLLHFHMAAPCFWCCSKTYKNWDTYN